jgi:TonB-dependent starch-binding outer membrane protein SusC
MRNFTKFWVGFRAFAYKTAVLAFMGLLLSSFQLQASAYDANKGLVSYRKPGPVKVSGVVTDAKSGQAIPGAAVRIKGTSDGAITDLDGKFTINCSSENVVLSVSFVGYKTQEVETAGKTYLEIKLEEELKSLDEVVVIGYGTARKSELTGAVSSVSNKTIASIPVGSAAEALTGKLAGVNISTTDGSPDAEIVIRVRGGGSVTQDNSPLYIVDGFPVSSINDIPPTDIASIDVLKDASTSAIYGARGANGVVIITTKSAKSGKTSVTYNGYIQAKELPKKLDVMSPYDYVLAQYEYAKLRDPNALTDLKNFTKFFGVYDDLELYKGQEGTDWQDKMFGNSDYSQYHNVSITGGTENTKLSLSLTNNNDAGILQGSGYNRTSLNFKLNHAITERLKVEFNSRYSNTDVDGAGTSGSSDLKMSDVITARPVNGLVDQFDINGSDLDADYETFISALVNPEQKVKQDYRKRIEKLFTMNGALSWEIMKKLTYRTEFGAEYGFKDNKRYYGPMTNESKNNGGNLPLGEITTGKSYKYRWANTLNYSFKTGDHDITALVGEELIINGSSNEVMRSKYFSKSIEPEKLFANMALGTIDRLTTFEDPEYRLSSFFGRVNYSFNSKYLLTFTLRADGSSKFAPGKQWGLFPAAAVAWRVSEENFVKQFAAVSNLKVRASFGEAGNDRIANDAWRRTYAISVLRPNGFAEGQNPYYVPASSVLVNPDLKWETTITRNAGIDFGFFKERLSGSVDLYWNTTKDLLVESDIPSYLGYTKQLRNIGQTSNRGIEIVLNGRIIEKKDFSLTASFNIGFNKNKIDELDGVDFKPFNSGWAGTDLVSADDYRLQIGKTVGLIYGFVSDGFYTVDDFASYDAASKKYKLKPGVANDEGLLGGQVGFRPGMMKLKNLGGDSTINTNDDRTVIGNANPKHSGGMNINLTYKSFDLGLNFTWKYGFDVYNTGKIAYNMYYRTTYGNMLNTVNYANRFKYIDAGGNIVTDLEALRELNKDASMWSPFSSGTAKPILTSDAIEDGSFLRLSTVTVGYSLPKSIIQKIRMQQLRFYATVYNAWIWTNYTGYDPEVSSTRSSSYSALTPGVDYSAYPKSRTYTIGVNITF